MAVQERVDLHDPAKRAAMIQVLERQMREAAANLEFELAAMLRDQLNELRAVSRARCPAARDAGESPPPGVIRALTQDELEARGRDARPVAPARRAAHLRGRSRGGQDDVHQGHRPRPGRRRDGQQSRPTRWCTATRAARARCFISTASGCAPRTKPRTSTGRACCRRGMPFWWSGPSGPASGCPRRPSGSGCTICRTRSSAGWSRSDVAGDRYRHRPRQRRARHRRSATPSRRRSPARGGTPRRWCR